MKFQYIASAANGKVVEGNLEATDTAQLLQMLAEKGLRPVSVKPMKGEEALSGGRHIFGQKITIADKVFLTKYLSIMLKVGTDLFQAITVLINDFEKPAMRAFLIEIRDALERGQPFYTTFAKYPQHFSPVFISLVKAGEASGNLDTVFEGLSVSLVSEKELRGKIKGALVYPMLLLALSLLILIFLTTFALPKLAGVFSGGGFKPPAFSRVVFAVGLFFNKYLWGFLSFFGLSGASIFIFSRSLSGKRFFAQLSTRLPVIRKIVYQLSVQRFASTLSSLMKAGIPILEAMTITADTVGHPAMRASLLRARDAVSQGISLGEAFRRENSFPFVVTNLVAIAEKAGHLEDILGTLGKFYESEIDGSIKNAVTFIEPVMLLFIGGVIGLIALSIIVPVYQLVGQL